MADVKIEVTRAALSTSAAGNTQDITISGFGTPAAAIFIVSSATTDDTIAADSLMMVGWTDGTNEVATANIAADNVATSNTARYYRTDRVISYCNASGTAIEQGGFSFDSWVTDGVRLYIDNDMPSAYLCTCILIGGTDVSNVYAGLHDDLGNGTSPIDITAPGFEPDIVFITHIGTSLTAPYNGSTSIFTLGCAVNDGLDTQRVAMYGSSDGVFEGSTYSYIGNDSITGQVAGNILSWDAVISDFDASGFSITPNAATGSDIINYLCLKFTNNPNIQLFDMQWPTTGDYAETGAGFEPSFGLIASMMGPSSRNTMAGNTSVGFSLAAFDANGVYTTTVTDAEAADPTVAKSLSSDQLRILDSAGSTDEVLASSYAFDADGWDFTLTTNPGSALLGWGLAIGVEAGTGTYISAPSPIGTPQGLMGYSHPTPSPLGPPSAYSFNNYASLIVNTQQKYIMTITGTPAVEIPISSWQATIQTTGSNYVQCVIPSASAYVDTLTARQSIEEIIVYKVSVINGNEINQELARAPLDTINISKGPYRETAVVSGYVTPPPTYSTGLPVTELQDVRFVSQSINGNTRIRSAIDWYLRPGNDATGDDLTITVSYINYYATSSGDFYMDVGNR